MNAPRKSDLNTVRDAMADTAEAAKDGIRDTVETGSDRMTTVMQKAGDTAVEAKDAVMSQANATLSGVRDAAIEKADAARETLSDVGARLASTLERASADAPQDALKSRVLSSVAEGLNRASTTLRQRSVADLTDDVKVLAKRHPGAFMAAAAVVGFAAARFVRSSARRRTAQGVADRFTAPHQDPRS